VSGRIVLHLDKGLGWTAPVFVAGCGDCGTELARHPNHDRAIRAARRIRCPACGTRTARRLPGTTSLAADIALSRGWREFAAATGRMSGEPPSAPNALEGGESPACLRPPVDG
jgi:DNA-directed RNA polymerase subunit RPC12/RpoP